MSSEEEIAIAAVISVNGKVHQIAFNEHQERLLLDAIKQLHGGVIRFYEKPLTTIALVPFEKNADIEETE